MEKTVNPLQFSKEELKDFIDKLPEGEIEDVEKLVDETSRSLNYHNDYYSKLIGNIENKISFIMATVSLIILSFLTIFDIKISESLFFFLFLIVGFLTIFLSIITMKPTPQPRVTLFTNYHPKQKKKRLYGKIAENIFLSKISESLGKTFERKEKYYILSLIFFYPFCAMFFISAIISIFVDILEFDCELSILFPFLILISIMYRNYEEKKIPPSISY